VGIDALLSALRDMVYVPCRDSSGPLVFSVDHCFAIRGQGTVLTGTVLQGALAVNDTVELPALNVCKKVKSMQMFRRPVSHISQGDRAGVCVTQFEPGAMERGLVCAPGLVRPGLGLLARVERIPYFKLAIKTKTKFHLSIGNQTVMAKATFFGTEQSSSGSNFDFEKEYKYQDELIDVSKSTDEEWKPSEQFAVIEFEKRAPVLPDSFVIGSKLDMDVHTNMCRLAFKGSALDVYCNKEYPETHLSLLKVYKCKSKEGVVERMHSSSEVIVKNLLKKDTNLGLFLGLKVLLSTGEEGVIEGTFGTAGKIKVCVRGGLKESTVAALSGAGKKKSKSAAVESSAPKESIRVTLDFKKYVFAQDKKKIIQ